MNNYFRSFLFAVLTIFIVNHNGFAIDVAFTGTVGDSWHDDANWDDGFAPSFADEEYFIQNELTAIYSSGVSDIRKIGRR